jgi:hypothetical protein
LRYCNQAWVFPPSCNFSFQRTIKIGNVLKNIARRGPAIFYRAGRLDHASGPVDSKLRSTYWRFNPIGDNRPRHQPQDIILCVGARPPADRQPLDLMTRTSTGRPARRLAVKAADGEGNSWSPSIIPIPTLRSPTRTI